jgi:hypothetical protein
MDSMLGASYKSQYIRLIEPCQPVRMDGILPTRKEA